jgi:hypothetical protein
MAAKWRQNGEWRQWQLIRAGEANVLSVSMWPNNARASENQRRNGAWRNNGQRSGGMAKISISVSAAA